jgi:hypothetical protein
MENAWIKVNKTDGTVATLLFGSGGVIGIDNSRKVAGGSRLLYDSGRTVEVLQAPERLVDTLRAVRGTEKFGPQEDDDVEIIFEDQEYGVEYRQTEKSE